MDQEHFFCGCDGWVDQTELCSTACRAWGLTPNKQCFSPFGVKQVLGPAPQMVELGVQEAGHAAGPWQHPLADDANLGAAQIKDAGEKKAPAGFGQPADA
jgi:hypothetical protein